jgi:hypothetical protein
MKTLLRLRQLKSAALDRMAELNRRAHTESRDLTERETTEYNLKRSFAEDLNGAIGLGELEQEVLESAPAAAPTADDAPPRPNLAERVLAWRIR